MDDNTLVIECVKGNAKAQRMLFDKFASKMMAVCMRYVNDSMEAEDVLQEGFVKVFSKLADFKMEGSLEGWIRRIMVNTSLDALRKNKRHVNDSKLEDVDFKLTSSEFERVTKYHAPTAKLTKKLTHKGRPTYIKLKD
jgi:RNA polymerase sigma-70 factor (ECF subfamily)